MYLSNLFMRNMLCGCERPLKFFCVEVRFASCHAPRALAPYSPQCALLFLKLSSEGTLLLVQRSEGLVCASSLEKSMAFSIFATAKMLT